MAMRVYPCHCSVVWSLHHDSPKLLLCKGLPHPLLHSVHFTLSLPRHCRYLQRKDGADASSTVTLEVADNLYLMVKHFQEITGEDPIIMMDNVKIQANIPNTTIESRYGTLNLPEGCRLRFPPHSSDINQVVEHSIGALKGGATEQLFEECGREVKFSEHSLQRIFKHQFKLFEQGHLYPKGVEHNMAKLPTVLRVIASEEDEWFLDENGKQHHGSNGNWPNAPDR